jgi:uncharacterized protein YjbI with pentapeptide repeats
MAKQERWPWRRWRSVAWQRRWWIALATLFILVWWLVPPLLYHGSGVGPDAANARLKAITDTRTGLLAGLIGVGALLTFWLNSRVYRITAQTLAVTEQGQITDRYAKAIEQLGSGTLDVRLGGIYALERITHDSPRHQDQATIVEVLSAFARVHSDPVYRLRRHQAEPKPEYWKEGSSPGSPQQEGGSLQEAERPRQRELRLAEEHVAEYPLPDDVQVAVTVLGRLPPRPGVSRGDLSDARLARARLPEANLSGARLSRANLSGARLDRANLSGAWLPEADLSSAQLPGANLSGAGLPGANLSGAQLPKAALSDANLVLANLSRANLGEAVLMGAQLGEANLSGAWLDRANLSGANLSGVDLRETMKLTQKQVDVARGDGTTRLPDGLRRPASWPAEQASSAAGS